jgi:LPXTG-motif cell wall-anchored protein
MPFDNNRKPKPMKSLQFVAALSGAVLVGLSTLVAAPAHALDPMTYTIDCSFTSETDPHNEVPIYAGQDAVFTFSPATCQQAYWSMLNPALSNNLSLSGTGSVTIAAADVLCDQEFEIVLADNNTYEYITLTGCEAAPAPADALPNTGADASHIGVMLAGAGLLTLAGAALMIVRRRTI